MSKKYCSNDELQAKILQGVETLADNVATTLGPKGRNVILQEKNKRPIITQQYWEQMIDEVQSKIDSFTTINALEQSNKYR